MVTAVRLVAMWLMVRSFRGHRNTEGAAFIDGVHCIYWEREGGGGGAFDTLQDALLPNNDDGARPATNKYS